MNTTYYISGSGNDDNDGLTKNSPFRSLQKAANLTKPGDVVLVMNGIYSESDSENNILTITNSGTPDRPITYRAFPGHKPQLQSQNWHAISVAGAAYIIIDGFEIVGNRKDVTLKTAIAERENLANPFTSGNGIGIISGNSNRKSHHVIVRNNTVHDLSGGGIYTINADYITIENNTVYNNAWYSPYGNSGISMYQNWNSDRNTDYKMIVRNNIVYGNQNLIPFLWAGEVTDGNGIIVDDSRHTQDSNLDPYTGKTLITNNIVYKNGGRGIHVYESDGVDIVHNTTYQNSRHPNISDGEITAIAAKEIGIYNNIIYATTGQRVNTLSDANRVSFDGNLLFNSDRFTVPGGDNLIGRDPLFVAPELSDFRLRGNSLALNFGSEFKGFDSLGADVESVFGDRSQRSLGTNKSDRLLGSSQDDLLEGFGGADRLLGKKGNDILLGGNYKDRLYGGSGNDTLYGDRGHDVLMGQAGRDWLVGGTGNDTLHGGKQGDYFVLQTGWGVDRITDFGEGRDLLMLPKNLVYEDLQLIERPQGVLIKVENDNLAWIVGKDASDLKANLFMTIPDFSN